MRAQGPVSTHMETLYQAFGFIAAVCIGIAVLTIFFTALGYLKRRWRGGDVVKMEGMVRDGRLVNVHLTGGRVLERKRLVGFTDEHSFKGGDIPVQLSRLVVLEAADGARTLIRADAVRVIEEVGGGQQA